MAKPLTAIAVANLKPRSQRYEVSDPGCAGLRVVVFPSRKKSFVVRFRFRGLPRKLTLGPCLGGGNGQGEPADTPELNTPLSLAAARELATKALRQAKSGSDPCAAKQRARQQERAAESDTLRAISDEYLRREGPRLRTLNQRRADLELLCASVLGRLPVAQITRGQYSRVLDHIADNNGLARSDRCLSALRTLLSWHASRSDFISPLVRGMRRTSPRERARSRVLTDEELRKVWLAAEQDKGAFGAFIKFTLLTATRRGESAALRRSELSDGGATWIIPGARYKNGKDHLIPLQPGGAGDRRSHARAGGRRSCFQRRPARTRSARGLNAKKPSTRLAASAAGGCTTCEGQRARCSAVLASVPTMPKCVSVTPWVACARLTTGTNIGTKSVTPSKRWPR